MGEFENLIPEFIEESLEHLKNIEEDIIQIEKGEADKELINSVFRAVHSVKGGSSFLGLKNIEKLSHKMEDIFNLVRNDNLEFSTSISTKVLTSIDKLKEMLEDSGESDNFDISLNIKEMESVISGTKDSADSHEISVQGFGIPVQMSKYKFDSYKKMGQNIYLLRMEFSEGEKYKNILDFLKEVSKTGEIIESSVDIEFVMSGKSFSGDGIPLKVIYASVLDKDLVAHTFEIENDDLVELKRENIVSDKLEDKIDNITEKSSEESPKDISSQKIVIDDKNDKNDKNDKYEEDEDIEAIGEENEFMTFLIGEEEYGIGIKLIQEIVTMQSITGVPDSEEYTKGIMNLRGDILPVYDFRLKLNFESREYDRETIILVISLGEKRFGLIVDRISEVIQLTNSQIKDAPNMKNIPSNFVLGIGQKDDKFVILLKVKDMIIGSDAA